MSKTKAAREEEEGEREDGALAKLGWREEGGKVPVRLSVGGKRPSHPGGLRGAFKERKERKKKGREGRALSCEEKVFVL